ncbi:PhzF family phenazine biosynthesis protein [Tsukamurella tyrosinosolvens]|uniref:PhzF family phenazine biosynthesis protein n=1 Tax=Tsukamurella tyrosinosolvens TaxID=57704 RepID=UPI000794221C|nr:PhzF family phenazine biosynthesis protein [Tsukamurella tyrosinosolvens]KXP02563.1 phenazine biosynthesis protein PhzF [Tsukamurella tyrosinosolvens]KZL96701.1 phenazine biosynthesis protein PhzF [Tsukamurella tyrosinosolvens]MCA4996609.1 PhzF family phenazine biosynthesis protein [Tsukamurella tyrosinosolvens]WEL93939.1 PhzF family phenazine biosynthesis protein [Tsukamurella tyrosinosolvens]
MHRFRQVDVFSSEPLLGNPVAVVHAADDLADEQMAAFARWTNLSETTFLLRPTDPAADYRLRIFTPGGELPFAGHPTLGSAHAWLEDGGVPASAGTLVQECGAGLVRLRRGAALAFAAPPLVRSGPADAAVVDRIAAGLRVPAAEILAAEWVDNGPGWVAARLRGADAVLALRPDFAAMGELNVGVVGAYPAGGDADVEIRAFCPSLAVPEDPVTGSLNAGIAQWLIGTGELPDRYTASQGTALGRRGRVHVERDGDAIWIGGATSTTICGEVSVS